ncbi:MAG: hypothetical protein IPK20_17395 [Betaproteobacteria bacterium]|nr:hypothetical protein [Betaproteobacteria bacterium]
MDVRNGTLQAGTSGALASTFVKVTGANARFDATPLRTVALAGLDTHQTPLELGSSAISLTGSGSLGATSHFEAGVNGNRSSGVVVGTLAEAALVIGGASGAAPESSFGYLRISRGSTSLVGTTVSLTAALSTTPDELGALQLDSGGTLELSAGASLTVTSTASVGGADLSVWGGSVLSVIRDATRQDLPATLAVGTGGGPAGVRVSGTQSRASSADRIVLGRTAARDAGTGVLVAGSGGTIESPVLSFATGSSRFLLNPGGTGRFNRLDDGGTGLGTVEMAGGTLIVGDTSFASPLGTSDSSFGGTLTGAEGTVRKVGAGEFFLSGVTNYLGTVQVDSGTLRVNPGTLANAVLTMLPGARLTVSGASPANPLRIGALEGEFDLEQQNLTLEFGAGLHEARWSGRFTSGTVGLARTSGPGVQRFTGGTEASPFTAPFLSVSTGAVRLGGGFFSFTDTASTPVATAPLDVSGANAVLGIVDGAQVRAGSGVRVHGGGLFFVTGTGSRLDVQPDSATGRSSLSVGQDGLGSLAMSAGGSVTASDLRLGLSRGPTSAEVSVAGGGQLFLDLLSFEGYGGTLIVSGGTAFIHRLDSVVHDPLRPSVIELSDGPSGTPALTLGTPGAAPGTSTRFRGSISDGALGPGSIRKIGSDEIIANPHISGRLIIDEGVFRVEDRTALEGATVEINRDDGLVYSSTLGDMVLMGALRAAGVSRCLKRG